ncbi:hypothetical protein PoB_005882200 [Plakobranchus ocellatus]|uniref:Uncharacterized protein n=1 Tax=Plakobranchus ocellatus TaxID=259542 RepID=A0AAV4CL42_9GAST|nr:hypothetical protein PoB_005882200 [Plakobranchus ocellatus]
MQTDSNYNTDAPQTLSSHDHNSNQNFRSLETVPKSSSAAIPSICQSHESSNLIPNKDANNDSANIADKSQLSSAVNKGIEVTVTELNKDREWPEEEGNITDMSFLFEPWPEAGELVQSESLPETLDISIQTSLVKILSMSSSEKYQHNDRSVSPMDDEEHLSTNLATPSRTFIPPAPSTPIKLLPTKSIAISPIIEQSMQTKESTTSPLIKFIDTISHAMDKSLSHPLSEHEERLASRLVQRKLYDGPQKRKTLLKIKTRGQPLTYMKVAVLRKCSQNVGATTLKKRARVMHSARRVVDSKMDVELGLIPQTRRRQVINKVNVSKKLLIGRRQGLILKETLGLSTRKARLMCQQLRELGVVIEGEASQRALAKGIIQDFVNVREKIFHKEDSLWKNRGIKFHIPHMRRPLAGIGCAAVCSEALTKLTKSCAPCADSSHDTA